MVLVLGQRGPTWRSERSSGDQSEKRSQCEWGARRVQGGCREGARRVQGGCEEGARRARGSNATPDGPPTVVTTLLPTKNEVLKI